MKIDKTAKSIATKKMATAGSLSRIFVFLFAQYFSIGIEN